MPKNNLLSQKSKLLQQINSLITKYEEKAQCGIFFKLTEDKPPSEIFGVLDFLKFKIKKWGNTNIFSYSGKIFTENTVLVIGSRNFEEAESIMIYMFLSNTVDNEYKIDELIDKLKSSNNLEKYLNDEISEHIEKGFPNNSEMELELRNHLEKMIKE